MMLKMPFAINRRNLRLCSKKQLNYLFLVTIVHFIDDISDLTQIAQYLNFLLLSSGHKSMSELHIFFDTDIAKLSSPEY